MDTDTDTKYAIVGWTGFIGQNLFAQMTAQGIMDIACYNGQTLQDIRGKSVGTLILSCMPATKWLVNKDPQSDLETLETIKDVLQSVHANNVILISTVDIMDATKEQTETGYVYSDHAYGIHRRRLEEFVQLKWPTSTIVRLSALFGQGLKKNALYDLLHGNNVESICLTSKFQWYDVGNLWNDLETWKRQEIRLIQPVSEPVPMQEIVDRWFPSSSSKCAGTDEVSYALQTLWSETKYWRSKEEVLEAMGSWISNTRSIMSRRLAASNIGFTMDPAVSTTLKHWGIHYLEVAPTRGIEFGNIQPWSMQSLLYGLPLLNIFSRPATFLCHCRNLMKHGSAKGIRRYVFGCPKQRTLITDTTDAISLFRRVGAIAAEYDVIFCIEPNARAYGCTWLNTLGEVLEFVKAVDHPNIRINLDSGNFSMESDPFPLEALEIKWIGHVQISAPHLHHRLSAEDMVVAKRFVSYLDSVGYTGCISFEARQPASFHEYRQGLEDFLHIFLLN